MNTKISYMYRDASNYKQCEEVIFEGEITEAEKEVILNNRDEGLYFIPSQVGLDDLQSRMTGYPNSDDHVWHELNENDIEIVSDNHTTFMSLKDFVSLWKNKKWDLIKASEEHGIR